MLLVWHRLRAMTGKQICGKPTVDGPPCQNLAGSCTANHPAGPLGNGSGFVPVCAAVPGPDPLAAFDDGWATRAALAKDGTTPLLLARLAVDPDPVVREQLAVNPHAAEDIIAGLAADPVMSVRASALENPTCPAAAVVAAVAAADRAAWTSSRADAAMGGVDPEALFAAVDDPAAVVDRVAETHETLGVVDGWRLQAAVGVGANPLVAFSDAVRLANLVPGSHPALVTNWSGPKPVVDGSVFRALVKTGDLPTAAAATDPMLVHRSASSVMLVLVRCAENESRSLVTREARKVLAARTDLPAGVLAAAATDSNARVRRLAAKSRSCPPAVLGQLAGDSEAKVRWETARNPGCPPATLVVLAADADPDVRSAAAANPSCPPSGVAAGGLLAD